MNRWIAVLIFLVGVARMPLLAGDDVELLSLGKETYTLHCARCHGDDGQGNGPDAKRLDIAPRNFTRGVYKFRSTASGTPPSDDDLMHVLNYGMSGAGMPSFANLGLDAKKGLIAYLKTFTTEFKSFTPRPLPEPNTKIKVDLSLGKEIYKKVGCALCHGEEGRANGTSAPTLVDQWGAPIKVANLTQGWMYRAGHSPRDIYFRLMSGIAGTPMPSYADALKAEEAWQLAQYVASLQNTAELSYQIVAPLMIDSLPTTGNDEKWKKAPRHLVVLDGAVYQAGRRETVSIKDVTVQALSNESAVVFRLTWNDTTLSGKPFPDQFVLAFKPHDFSGNIRENLSTAYLDSSSPFDLAHWSSDSLSSVREGQATFSSFLKNNAILKTPLSAEASYKEGLWTLVFTRPIKDALNSKHSIAFAAWDGGRGEMGMKKTSSQWVTLSIGNVQKAHH